MGNRDEIEALLVRAKTAHGQYEQGELNGVYDQDWPRWYARFVVEHGLADLVGRPIDVGELEALFVEAWADQERTAPAEPWERFTATRISMLAEGPPSAESVS